MRAAAAKVIFHMAQNLLFGGLGGLEEQGIGGQNHSRRAESALERVVREEGLLAVSYTHLDVYKRQFQLPAGVRFRCGGRVFSGDPAVVVDLSDFARHHRFEITGILGYPALRNSIVTIDYRDSLVRIEGR